MPFGFVYFCEVQFQRDERLYERLFGELKPAGNQGIPRSKGRRTRRRGKGRRARGRQQEAAKLVLKLLTRRLDQALSTEVRSQIEALPLLQLEALSETLLDFTRRLVGLVAGESIERKRSPV